MGKICYVCGDAGYEELLVTCTTCEEASFHVYCMKTIETGDLNQAMCVCEKCEETPKHAPRKFSEEPAKRKTMTISTDEAIALASQLSPSKVAGKRHFGSQEKAYKKVEVTKKRVENDANVVRPIGDLRVCSAEKRSALPSSEQKRYIQPPVHPSAVPRPSSKQKSCAENPVHTHTPSPIAKPSSELRSSIESTAEPKRQKKFHVHESMPSTVPGPSSKQKSCTENPVHTHTRSPISKPSSKPWSSKESSAEPKGYKKFPVHESMPSTVPGPSSKQKSCRENNVHACTLSPISKPSPEPRASEESLAHAHAASTKSGLGLAQGGTPCKDTLKTGDNVGEGMLSDKQLTIDRHLPNYPADSATWKGTLTIGGYETPVGSCNDVWAHPPLNLSKKAYDFAMKMQMKESIHFEPIPRSAIWGNMFHDRGPGEFDIGLYFIPNGDRSEHCCSRLISYLEKQDIALRCFIYGIQLLIFSSSHLEEESIKINDASYLWGLFAPLMITRKEPVQISDVPVPNDSHPSCSKSNKAAASASQPISDILVKLEKSDSEDLASPPKSPAHAVPTEPRIPPGFKKKYKTMSKLLQAGED